MTICRLANGAGISSQDLDDTMYRLDNILDYRVQLSDGDPEQITLEYLSSREQPEMDNQRITELLKDVPAIAENLQQGSLEIGSIVQINSFPASHTLKRTIIDLRSKTQEMQYA